MRATVQRLHVIGKWATGAALLTTLVGCSMGRVDRRVEYWEREAREHVPSGSSLEGAQAFFASKGLQLRCCTSGPDITDAYYATDRDVGRFVFTSYSVEIVVDAGPDHSVTRVRVFRIGVGL